MGYYLKADELVGLGRGAIHMVGMVEKRRERARPRTEEVVAEGVVVVAEVRAGREK